MATPNDIQPSDRHIALLIDADNVPAARLPGILAELVGYGTANVRRAYGDWTNPSLKGWRALLHEYAIRPQQQFNYTKSKNSTDIALVIDAMELLYTQNLAAFCIASSDADFTPLAMHLRAAGKPVYGFGERKTPEAFVNACTTFLYLEDAPSDPGPLQTDGAKTKAPSKKPQPDRQLAMDTKLVATLRGAVESAARDDGWAHLGTAGSAVKRLAPIDPRNYGAKTFTDLFKATGLFEVQKAGDGQHYVADKRNKERSAQPGGGAG